MGGGYKCFRKIFFFLLKMIDNILVVIFIMIMPEECWILELPGSIPSLLCDFSEGDTSLCPSCAINAWLWWLLLLKNSVGWESIPKRPLGRQGSADEHQKHKTQAPLLALVSRG